MPRQNISSGSKWEPIVGYSRAVRIGNWISVAGTTASDENGQPIAPGDPYAQTVYAIRKIEKALTEAGATLENVIRTRIFVIHMQDWEHVGRAHGEIFGAIRPACTLVEVRALIDPQLLVEIEADAYIERD